jgi:hypothetical protein
MTEKRGPNNERYGKVRRNGAFQQGHGKAFTAGGAFVCNNLSKQRCLGHYLWLCNHFSQPKRPATVVPLMQRLYLRALPLQAGGNACSTCHFGLTLAGCYSTATAQWHRQKLGSGTKHQTTSPSLNVLRSKVKQNLNTLRLLLGPRRIADCRLFVHLGRVAHVVP